MSKDACIAPSQRVAAYFKLIEAPETTLFEAVQALVGLKESDLELIGKSRAELAAALLQRYPAGGSRA